MHSSDRVQTVRDIRLRIPDIPGAKVDFTLIGTRDANENPVPVNVPMKVILPDEIVSDSDTDPTTTLNSDSSVVPTAEELRAGKKPAIVNMDANENGYPENTFIQETESFIYMELALKPLKVLLFV